MSENRVTEGNRDFDHFMREVYEVLGGKADSKGYSSDGPDGPNPLFEMTGVEHALGEIIYKAVRYRRRHDPEDLKKIAAWAFLAWRYHTGGEAINELGIGKR